jgi:hypothetical protein
MDGPWRKSTFFLGWEFSILHPINMLIFSNERTNTRAQKNPAPVNRTLEALRNGCNWPQFSESRWPAFKHQLIKPLRFTQATSNFTIELNFCIEENFLRSMVFSLSQETTFPKSFIDSQ